ncbi:FAD-dependent oxidoreductase [Desulfogranum japonicum]|uniref:FAD-dependent oxidoreductase n=1 Tax=Desulfogranum japonicum TaxID=231447 RepID=UPI000409E977|nr:FAD-dependent oxidoreductase [Desulfogranum japonicum]
MPEGKKIGAVMVVGGGIAGMQAALDLADAGFFVYLIEKSGAIGGAMPQFDKTYPTNDCSMCIIAPKLVECGRHRNIKIITLAEVEQIQGTEGDFTAHVKESPRYIDQERCIACGQCSNICPVSTEDDFNCSLGPRKAIFIKYPQAVPLKYEIDSGVCLHLKNDKECGICRDICPAEAIIFHDTPKHHEIHVGAIILAPGFQAFNPQKRSIWGFGKFPNVLSSMQLERILAPTGPTGGVLARPSDNSSPKSIAFLQCVGSRDKNHCNNEYCSSVCCMSAIKEAIMIKELLPEVEITIFYTDMRTHGKDFDRYFNRSQKEYNIQYTRAKIHSLEPGDRKGSLRLHYANEQGRQVEKFFDMVILSVGLETPDSAIILAERMGIHITPDRFASISAFMPVSTSKKGIFTCGAFNGPRDIPQAVIGGSAAAACAEELLSAARFQQTAEISYPEERHHQEGQPRIGVYVCHCGTNIAGVIDVDNVATYARTLPGVIHVEQNLFSCAQDTQDFITQQIREKNLDSIVVAACSPRTHEPLFRQTLKAAGINEFLIEMANIRNQDAWVHKNTPGMATEKAKDLIRMAVAKVTLQKPLHPIKVPVIARALIIGGGVSGMTSALNLAGQGFKVELIEKSSLLGGNALHLYQTWSGEHVPLYLKELQEKVFEQENITVHLKTTVTGSTGHAGHFKTVIKSGSGRKKTIEHGATIIASGGKRYIPKEFSYGKIPNVVASIEFDKLHMHNEVRIANGESFVFIQCVGSRNTQRPYCSKSCCTHSIQSAIKLKKEVPSRRIYILYREIRTYGQRERIYNQARELGIIFINYELHGEPTIAEGEKGALVQVYDHVLHRPLEIEADLVILASATLSNPDSKDLANIFKLPLNSDGFFQEAHVKLRPVEFNTDGIFVTGLAHYPKPVEESISQSLAAAAKASALLSKKTIELDPITAIVDLEHCDGCALCIEACPYAAITLVETATSDGEEHKIVEIDPALCKGCGICQGICPKRGVNITGFDYDQLLAQIEAALQPAQGHSQATPAPPEQSHGK